MTEIIQRYPRAKVAIAGHTDAKGEEIYNFRLSEKRAAAVKTWLIQHGGGARVDGSPRRVGARRNPLPPICTPMEATTPRAGSETVG